jgi:D-alanyl-D-alanine carboxypeptidase/D-alanyl-D-alanine-endopeptidase (penicillin-binding protein 4)
MVTSNSIRHPLHVVALPSVAPVGAVCATPSLAHVRRWWLVVIAAAVLVSGGWAVLVREGKRADHPVARATTPPAVPEVTRTPLLGPAPTGAAVPTAAGVRAALSRALANPLLARVAVSVVDVETGTPVLEVAGDRAVVPASTTKLVTAMAALAVLPSDQRLTTRVVAGAGDDVVLVGAGDPTLRGPKSTGAGPRLVDLATQLKRLHRPFGRVLVDDSLFTGPRTGPGWKAGYVTDGDVVPVSALELSDSESTDPALESGRQLAAMIGATGTARGTAPGGAAQLAAVSSAPIPDLVERMLTASDNDLAEALGRHVALATRQPASFAGAAAAIKAAVEPLLPSAGMTLRDASGLSPQNRIQPATLTRLLVLAARDERFGAVLSGMPVAGFDGTLEDRYRKGPTAIAAGEVRAKTGTLTGVSALAGLLRTRDGRLLAFDITADAVPETGSARVPEALDEVATALVQCGCR